MEIRKVLVLYSYGAPRLRERTKDTIFRGILGVPYTVSSTMFGRSGGLSGIARRFFEDPYASLGYMNDWREAIKNELSFNITECNINDYIAYLSVRSKIRDFDLIFVLHSAAGDDLRLLLKTASWFEKRSGKLLVFLGNEYDLIKEKKKFIFDSGADFICTQLPIRVAQFVYSDLPNANIIETPHALNEQIYNQKHIQQRNRQMIFVGARYPVWIGDADRNNFVDLCSEKFSNENSYIRNSGSKLSRFDWSELLRSARGTFGAEAGTYYLDKDGEVLRAAKKFYRVARQGRDFDFNLYIELNKLKVISGKAISSRHLEPLGTGTVQLLLEGDYNGILEPGKHYLSVKKDLTNFNELIREFMDESRRKEIADEGYDYAMDCHTYKHRIEHILRVVS